MQKKMAELAAKMAAKKKKHSSQSAASSQRSPTADQSQAASQQASAENNTYEPWQRKKTVSTTGYKLSSCSKSLQKSNSAVDKTVS